MLSLLEDQLEIEKLYAKNNRKKRLLEIFDIPEINNIISDNNLKDNIIKDLLIAMSLHKRTNAETLVGILLHHYDSAQQCADDLERFIDLGLVNYDPRTRIFIVAWDISPEEEREIRLYQFPLPLLVKPRKVKCNNHSGYYTFKKSLILNNNYHTEDICLDHINRVNRIPLEINEEVFNKTRNKLKNEGRQFGETKKAYDQRKKQFENFTKETTAIVEVFKEDKFYLTHAYDKRGRIYTQGYHINIQSTDWGKSWIDFHHKEMTKC